MKTRRHYYLWLIALLFTGTVYAQKTDSTISLIKIMQVGLEKNFDLRLQQINTNKSKGLVTFYEGGFGSSLGIQLQTEQGEPLSGVYNKANNVFIDYTLATKTGIDINTGINAGTTDIISPEVKSNASNAWIGLEIPLLQDFGKNNSKLIALKSARSKLNAALLNEKFQVNTTIKDIFIAYWIYVEAYQYHQILMNSYAFVEKYVSDIEILIQNDILPAAERDRSTVFKNNKDIDLKDAMNRMQAAYNNLCTVIGLERQGLTLPIPIEDVPILPDTAINNTIKDAIRNINEIINSRLDILSMEQMLESSRFELAGAKNKTRHQLNISIKESYGGINIGNTFEPYKSGQPGFYTLGTIVYRLPVNNRTAKGNVYMAQANMEYIEKQKQQLQINIKNNVLLQCQNLSTDFASLTYLTSNSKIADDVYYKELAKLKLGASDQINVINSYDTWIDNELTLLQVKTSLINDLILLKYLTGKLSSYTNN